MSNDVDLELITQLLLSEAPVEEIGELLTENYFKEERHETQMEYLYLLEQYLDDCSVYAFQSWEEGIVVGAPMISKFWVECDMAFPLSLDTDGIRRILGKNKQNHVKINKTETRYELNIKILRSILDSLEEKNRIDAKKEAEQEGYRDEPPEQQQDQAPMGGMDPMGGAPGGGMGGAF